MHVCLTDVYHTVLACPTPQAVYTKAQKGALKGCDHGLNRGLLVDGWLPPPDGWY